MIGQETGGIHLIYVKKFLANLQSWVA